MDIEKGEHVFGENFNNSNENSCENTPACNSPNLLEEKENESELTEIEDCGVADGIAEVPAAPMVTETPNVTVNNNEPKSEKSPKKKRLMEISIPEDDPESLHADQEFTWDEYIVETGCIPVPPIAFSHVEHSLESGIKIKMVLEVPNREDNDAYWQASVVMICGPLLSLRYLGYDDDRSGDFWWDISTSEVHAIGWTLNSGKKLLPPKAIINLRSNWESLLSHNLEAIPAYLLEGNGSIPVDQIISGMHLEVQIENNPLNVWIAIVIENVGGRLLLRFFGDETNSHDFWMFYLSHRIHPVGWSKLNNYSCNPPVEIKSLHTDEEWEDLKIKSQGLTDNVKSISPDLLQPQEIIENHSFEENMKLEALHPGTKLHIYPATVSHVINSKYFMVQIDDYRKEKNAPVVLCCHASSQDIFPINWTKENLVKIRFPKGYIDNPGNKEFDWEKYLNFCEAKPAPRNLFMEIFTNPGFDINTKLEAVNPFNPNQICAATVTQIVEPLLWIQLDSVDITTTHHIVSFNSQDIFPVGWCESNHYPLKPPRASFSKRQRKLLRRLSNTAQDLKNKKSKNENHASIKENSKSWCSKIYFNHRCFSGPLLSKSRLAQLPQHIGPGPVTLVMKEVLSSLINVAYKSSRVLKELQLRGKATPNMNQEVLKAKWKGKSYRAVVEVVTKREQVEDFCKRICSKLECCSNLFGFKHNEGHCPEQCHLLTKTKYSANSIVRKRKIRRAPFGPQPAIIPKVPGKKKKFNNLRLLETKNDESEQIEPDEIAANNEEIDQGDLTNNFEENKIVNTEKFVTESNESPTIIIPKSNNPLKRKYKIRSFTLPKSSMVTRGAKIPNFSLEMKWRRQRVRKLIAAPERPNQTLTQIKRKVGRPPSRIRSSNSESKDESPEVFTETVKQMATEQNLKLYPVPDPMIRPIPVVNLLTNPINWTVEEVANFVKKTDCAQMARALRDEDVDGQALLLMTLPVVQEFLRLKFAPAVKLCHLIEGIKLAFYLQFTNTKGE